MTSENARLTESVDGEIGIGPAPEMLAPGSIIADRYEVRRVLGSGGYAIVYLALDRRLNTEVALKAMRADRNSAAALTRFRREVNIAREAASPRLVRVYDIGADGDLWYLTMEVVRGESLRERMRRGPLAIAEAIEITNGILEGLAALHTLKVVHRDLKPENVLLDADGVPKLADFGLARFLDEERGATATGAVVGTTDYLSPEQALGRAVDSRGDLYALGVVLFEMLAGRLPFQGESSLGSVIARLRSPAPSVRKYRRDVPYWLSSVITRLLSKDPNRRYRDASEVLRAIDGRSIDLRAVLATRRIVVAAIAAGLVCASILFAPSQSTVTKFARIAPDGSRGVVAIGHHGETLWRIDSVFPEVHYALVRVRQGAAPVLAMVLIHNKDFLPESRQTLLLVDPESGKTLRQIKLPSAGTEFPAYTNRFVVLSLFAEDLDGDGVDEILIGYHHVPEAPFYMVMYEPQIDRARVVFQAMGGHVFVGAHDIDGDGKKELLFAGINNGVNWYNALAALHIDPPVNDPRSAELISGGPPRSPDMFNSNDASLLWYVLIPQGLKGESPAGYVWNDARREVTIPYSDRPPAVVTYDGFLSSETSTVSPIDRQKARVRAWSRFCRTRQLVAGGRADEALAEAKQAISEAESASDSRLIEVMRCAYAKTVIATSHPDEGDQLFSELVKGSDSAMELAYDAGRAFHLKGDIDRAVRWYQRGMAEGGENYVGKSKHEFIQAIIFALGERGEWQRASEALDEFRGVFPEIGRNINPVYRNFIRWRTGARPRAADLPELWNDTDLRRYWKLEFRNAEAADPQTVMSEVEKEISWNAEPLGPLWSLKAELLARTGKTAEAADAARRAWEITSADAKTNLIARGHLALVRERLTRYAGQ
jgi:tetratricopeptide (TPR) repeat protein